MKSILQTVGKILVFLGLSGLLIELRLLAEGETDHPLLGFALGICVAAWGHFLARLGADRYRDRGRLYVLGLMSGTFGLLLLTHALDRHYFGEQSLDVERLLLSGALLLPGIVLLVAGRVVKYGPKDRLRAFIERFFAPPLRLVEIETTTWRRRNEVPETVAAFRRGGFEPIGVYRVENFEDRRWIVLRRDDGALATVGEYGERLEAELIAILEDGGSFAVARRPEDGMQPGHQRLFRPDDSPAQLLRAFDEGLPEAIRERKIRRIAAADAAKALEERDAHERAGGTARSGPRIARDPQADASAAPLFQSLSEGDKLAVREHLRAGAALGGRDEFGRTPLIVAVLTDDPELVEMLVDAGADVDAHAPGRPLWEHELAEAALQRLRRSMKGPVRFPKAYLDLATAQARRSNALLTPLGAAIEIGNPQIMDLLLQAQVSLAHPTDLPPLHSAIEARRPDFVDKLTNAGADVEQVDHEGFTPLATAARENDLEAVKSLLAAGADTAALSFIDSADAGETALQIAAGYVSKKAFEALAPHYPEEHRREQKELMEKLSGFYDKK